MLLPGYNYNITWSIPLQMIYVIILWTMGKISWERVNREVQTVNWEADKEGGCRERCQEGPEKGA